jgi:hypothetical protein
LINNKTLIGIAYQGFYILTIVEEIRLFLKVIIESEEDK